jgi:type VI secretion system protein VasJ
MNETLVEPEVSEFVSEYLNPIPGNSPAGTDASNGEEYFKLNMEFPKTVPDYKNWIELSDIILKEKSKDIKIASWLCFALYRTENIKGLRNGLELVYHLLRKFGNDLFPQNPVHKSKAIQFLNTTRVTKLLEREAVNKSNASDISGIAELLNLITAECEKLLPGNVPVLQGIKNIIESHKESLQNTSTQQLPVAEKKTEMPAQPKPIFRQPSATAVKEESAPAAKPSRPASEDEAGTQLRRTLTYFYEVIQNNEPTERVPESFFTFGIARQLQWSTLVLPTAEENVTNIEPPNEIIRNLVKTWIQENKNDILIPRIEMEFIKDNSEFRYWLDSQRYLVHALERKGGPYTISAEDIKYYLTRLIKRLPELQNLKFRGGEIPFAEKETIRWLNDLIRNSAAGGKSSESESAVSTPIIDPTYDEINIEYEQAINELPKKFEDNFRIMQEKLRAEERSRGKFLRRLNMANFCYEAKQYNVAKVNLEELKVMIDELKLAEWEPALSTAVWQSLYLTNIQLLFTVENEPVRNLLENEQEELFYKIAKYNGLLAINLEQQKHKRRK